MRVIHLAGFTLPAEFLCSQHQKFGINSCIHSNKNSKEQLLHRQNSLEDISSIVGEKPSIIHFHGMSSLEFINSKNVGDFKGIISAAKNQGTQVVFSAYGDSILEPISSTIDLLSDTFDHVFISCPASLLLKSKLKSWSWLSPGLPSDLSDSVEERDIRDRALRVIRLGGSLWDKESDSIDKILNELHSSNKIQLMHFDLKESYKIDDLIALF